MSAGRQANGSLLNDEDAQAVARILYDIHQRRATRLAAEQAEADLGAAVASQLHPGVAR